jgi:DNA-binding PadR family transcriptional regulator
MKQKILRRTGRASRPISAFSVLVMRAIQALPREQRYGLPICDRINEQVGDRCDSAQVYMTLKRLQDRGYLRSHTETLSRSSSRPVRRYEITRAGVEAIHLAAAFYRHCQ